MLRVFGFYSALLPLREVALGIGPHSNFHGDTSMSMKQMYYGQPDGSTVPDVALTGNPGTDQITLTSAGYLGGKVMSLKNSATAGRGTVIVPCDGNAMVPFGFLINGPGEFAGSIGPSGSGKAPIVRAFPQFQVDSQAYVGSPTAPYTVGSLLYAGTGGSVGLITADKATNATPIGICTQVPTAQVPWLGVASLL